MNTPRENLLCRYRYDPLDRLTAQGDVQRFYLKSRLTAEVDGALIRSIFQYEETLLAQHEHGNSESTSTLLVTDQQRSVLGAVDSSQRVAVAYSPHGHASGLLGLLGFNGERRDAVTGHYLLGNGYRGFNPVLMRFNSPDSLSPFGKGGVNAYAYCLGDPINLSDPTGHIFRRLLRWLGLRTPRGTTAPGMPITRSESNAVLSGSLPVESGGLSQAQLDQAYRFLQFSRNHYARQAEAEGMNQVSRRSSSSSNYSRSSLGSTSRTSRTSSISSSQLDPPTYFSSAVSGPPPPYTPGSMSRQGRGSLNSELPDYQVPPDFGATLIEARGYEVPPAYSSTPAPGHDTLLFSGQHIRRNSP